MTRTSLRPGFIGLGLMGQPMSRRLLTAGFPLQVWNRNAAKAAALGTLGAGVCESPAQLANAVDVIMLCVSDSEAVDELIRGQYGILPQLRAGQIVVDFSSIRPDLTRELAAAVRDVGAHWVDCPVSGGVAGAESGRLAMMAGGDADVIAVLQPLLQPLSQRVTHVGPNGAGQTVKVINQMLVSCNVLVMAEALAMGEKAGVDCRQIPAALAGGFADSLPLQLTGPRMTDSDFEAVKWHVKTLLKDLDMANQLAQSLGSAIPMAGQAAELMRLHGSQGYLEQDPATCIELYREKPQ